MLNGVAGIPEQISGTRESAFEPRVQRDCRIQGIGYLSEASDPNCENIEAR
jgi:hypothetical protein